MRVTELMSTDLITIPSEADMKMAAEQMLRNQVGSVIVTHNGTPSGIITEADALTVGYVTDNPFCEINVKPVMSHPLKTIEPTITVRAAVNRMLEEDVKKLPVVEELELLGIITMTDIIRAHSDLLNEARKIEKGRGRRDPAEWRGPFDT